jgi:hypothetical protein
MLATGLWSNIPVIRSSLLRLCFSSFAFNLLSSWLAARLFWKIFNFSDNSRTLYSFWHLYSVCSIKVVEILFYFHSPGIRFIEHPGPTPFFEVTAVVMWYTYIHREKTFPSTLALLGCDVRPSYTKKCLRSRCYSDVVYVHLIKNVPPKLLLL